VRAREDQSAYVELDRQTFGDYLDQWLAGKVKLKAGTRLSYETHLRLYLRPGLGTLSWRRCGTTTSRSCTPRCG
jgi:hypothetical protein